MTLDPAPPVLGGPGPGDDGARSPSVHGDEARARAFERRQWLRRRELERQLHDGAALRISALTLRLGLLRHAMAAGEHDLRVTVEDLQDELHVVLQELRDVAGRLYPPLLDEAGLGPALREAAGKAAVPVRVEAPDERFGAAVEGAAYFALLPCLSGACPDDGPDDGRADGSRGGVSEAPIEIVVRRDDGNLSVLVTGVDACHAASIHDGVRPLGGTVVVGNVPDTNRDSHRDTHRPASNGSAPTAPASITVRIPCA
jgi:hypothetical protein